MSLEADNKGLIISNEAIPVSLAIEDRGSVELTERLRSSYLKGVFDMAEYLISPEADPIVVARLYAALGLDAHFEEPKIEVEKVGNSLRLKG